MDQVADCKGSTRVLQQYFERLLLVDSKRLYIYIYRYTHICLYMYT